MCVFPSFNKLIKRSDDDLSVPMPAANHLLHYNNILRSIGSRVDIAMKRKLLPSKHRPVWCEVYLLIYDEAKVDNRERKKEKKSALINCKIHTI